MKKLIPIIIFIVSWSFAEAQLVGIGLATELSLYQRYKKPNNHPNPSSSSGQILSFPAIGPKIWFGDWEEWTISIEGKIDYSVLSFDIPKYSGMGAISFPVVIKGNFSPFNPGGKGTTKIGIGFGAQWTKSELYFRQKRWRDVPNPFFMTYLGELSCQLVVGDSRHSSDKGHTMEIFVRPGWGKNKARTISFGIKYSFRYNFY